MKWLIDTGKRSAKTQIIMVAESTRHYWFTFAEYLRENDTKFVFVNPIHVKRTKEIDNNHSSKNDRQASKGVAKLIRAGGYLITYIPEGI